MSVIVAIRDNNRIVVGCDTRISTHSGSYFDGYHSNPKAIHANTKKDIIVASVR